jgi:hypothetical protein
MEPVREKAQEGLRIIENAMLDLLRRYPEGLTNAEIAQLLGIESDASDSQRNRLSWAILTRLLRAARIEKINDGKRRLVYRLPSL